jgi:transcriptional antiterminator Rof (Rho-off)
MSNDYPPNANEIYDQLEIPCDYILELDSSLFTTGTTEVGICPIGGLGAV